MGMDTFPDHIAESPVQPGLEKSYLALPVLKKTVVGGTQEFRKDSKEEGKIPQVLVVWFWGFCLFVCFDDVACCKAS